LLENILPIESAAMIRRSTDVDERMRVRDFIVAVKNQTRLASRMAQGDRQIGPVQAGTGPY